MKKLFLFLLLSVIASSVLAEPPAVYPIARYYRSKGLLTLEYDKRIVMTAKVPEGYALVTRQTSDGCFMSTPLFEQFYLSSQDDQEVKAEVTFDFKGDALCMKPKRAREGEAVLGQVGRPLIYGVNGVYSIQDDLMIDWTDANWKWTSERFEVGENGNPSVKSSRISRTRPLSRSSVCKVSPASRFRR